MSLGLLLRLYRQHTILLEEIMSTAADLKTAIDNLTAAVAKVQAEVAALKAQQPLIDQVS